ncbi:chloride channel protein [Cellulomonas composti]|uniref:Chloride channel protein n=1 Tax=Cellulomonas composti TaxID=266130 RepID=A0A511JBI8_9CELL|nr:chloride channel protein [Cellulomonas composti]GEL95338.1 hypothetical protein CCO02nite_19960 [Cellulomonas composti]
MAEPTSEPHEPATESAPAPARELVPPASLRRLSLLGALIGIPVGLVAFGFITSVHYVEGWLWEDLPEALGTSTPPWYLVLGLPALGGVLVHVARMLPGDGGHSPIMGVAVGGNARPRDVWGVALAALATLPFGIVLGPEAPLIALGTIVAVWLTGWARLGPREGQVVGVAGAGAAMSTLFGGPLVSGLMLLEGGVGAGALVIPMLIPALASSAVAYVLITGLGTWSGLPMAGLAIVGLPEYRTVLVRDLVVAVVVGVLAALLARSVRYAATRLAQRESPTTRLPILVLGGLAVGGLALGARALGADSQDVLFSGQASVGGLVTQTSAWTVLVLLVAKALAYTISLGAGFRGGPIFPAIFLGAALATFAVIAFDVSPTVAVAIGAAAGMTAMTRMVVAPVLFAGLLVGRDGVTSITVAVLGTVTAWLTSAALDHQALRHERGVDADRAAVSTAPAGSALPGVTHHEEAEQP